MYFNFTIITVQVCTGEIRTKQSSIFLAENLQRRNSRRFCDLVKNVAVFQRRLKNSVRRLTATAYESVHKTESLYTLMLVSISARDFIFRPSS